MKKLTFVRSLISALSLFTCLFRCVEGKDFEVMGNTFPISEESMIRFFTKTLDEMPSSLLAKKQEDAKRRLAHLAKHPHPISFLREAAEHRSFLFDPSYTATEEIKDSKGNVLVSLGAKVNPLESVSLSSGLLFFNGEDERHIEWAKKQTGNFKWVLIKGSPIALEQKEQRPVYYDQAGKYVSRFQIQQVPARVTQKGLRLLIEEIPVKNGLEEQSMQILKRNPAPSTSTQDEISAFIAMAMQNFDQDAMLLAKEIPPALEEDEKKCSTKAWLPSEAASSSRRDLFIFISFSVPLESWKDLSSELTRAGGVFVLNGIPNNSFLEFAAKVEELRKNGVDAPIQINPQSFEKYDIDRVPAIVLDDGRDYVKIYGNVPLSTALNLFSGAGSMLSRTILNYLNEGFELESMQRF